MAASMHDPSIESLIEKPNYEVHEQMAEACEDDEYDFNGRMAEVAVKAMMAAGVPVFGDEE